MLDFGYYNMDCMEDMKQVYRRWRGMDAGSEWVIRKGDGAAHHESSGLV